jgi:inosine triphosphate pyrophosphatase
MMNEIVLVTSNAHKVEEFARVLAPIKINPVNMELVEIQGNGEEIVRGKVLQAFAQVKKPVLVDDTGLFIETWNNLPGMYVKDFIVNVGNDGIFRMLKDFSNKKAVAKCFIGYCKNESEVHIFIGEVPGTIVSPRGENNFGKKGWDAIFLPDGKKITFGEMTEVEKTRDSHRVRALNKLKEFFSHNEKKQR